MVGDTGAYFDVRLDGSYTAIQVWFGLDEGPNAYDDYGVSSVLAEAQLIDPTKDPFVVLASGEISVGAPTELMADVTGLVRLRFRVFPKEISGEASRMAILSVYAGTVSPK